MTIPVAVKIELSLVVLPQLSTVAVRVIDCRHLHYRCLGLVCIATYNCNLIGSWPIDEFSLMPLAGEAYFPQTILPVVYGLTPAQTVYQIDIGETFVDQKLLPMLTFPPVHNFSLLSSMFSMQMLLGVLCRPSLSEPIQHLIRTAKHHKLRRTLVVDRSVLTLWLTLTVVLIGDKLVLVHMTSSTLLLFITIYVMELELLINSVRICHNKIAILGTLQFCNVLWSGCFRNCLDSFLVRM